MGQKIKENNQDLETMVKKDPEQTVEVGREYADQGDEDQFIKTAVLLNEYCDLKTVSDLVNKVSLTDLYNDELDLKGGGSVAQYFTYRLFKKGYDLSIIKDIGTAQTDERYKIALQAGRFDTAQKIIESQENNQDTASTITPTDAIAVLGRDRLDPSPVKIIETLYSHFDSVDVDTATNILDYDQPNLINVIIKNEDRHALAKLAAEAVRKNRLWELDHLLDELKQYDDIIKHLDRGGLSIAIRNGQNEAVLRVLDVFDDLRKAAVSCAIGAKRGRLLITMLERDMVPSNMATNVLQYFREHNLLTNGRNVKLTALST